jgi:hypothetical protein
MVKMVKNYSLLCRMTKKISFFITFSLVLMIAFVFVFAHLKSAFAQITEDTFSAKGLISSFVSGTNESRTTTGALGGNTSVTTASHNTTIGPPSLYKLAGTWRLDVKSGNVNYFEASFVMSHGNATNHSSRYNITNFHVEKGRYIQIYPDGTAFIPGTIDIKTNGFNKWKNANATIVIDKLMAMEIVLDSNKTNFKDPIRGVTNSITNHLGRQMMITTSNNSRTITPSGSTLTMPPPSIGAYLPNTNPSSSQLDTGNNINPHNNMPSTNTQSQIPSSNQINPRHLPIPLLPNTNMPILPSMPSPQPEPPQIAPPFQATH